MGFRALLVGINAYTDAPLRGCINDIEAIHRLLNEVYDVPSSSIRMLKDSQATAAQITEGLGWLAQPDGDGSPAVRLFHFSGHGTYAPDDNGDEPDGQDECLVPFDHAQTGPMRDDALHAHYDAFDDQTHLLLIMDCCHSGTNQRDDTRDRLFRFLPVSEAAQREIDVRRADYQRTHAQPPSPEELRAKLNELRRRGATASQIDEWLRAAWSLRKPFGTTPARDHVVHLSACKDNQTAADAGFGGTYHGALTYYLIEALRREPEISYHDLIDALGQRLARNKFPQEPGLSAADDHRRLPFLRKLRSLRRR